MKKNLLSESHATREKSFEQDKSMKIVIFSQYFWPETFIINDVAKAFAKGNCEVIVITGKPNYPSGVILSGYANPRIQFEMYGKVKIVRLPILPRGSASKYMLALNYLSFITVASLYSCYFALTRPKIDAILTFGLSPVFQVYPASLLSLLLRKPMALWLQDLWPDSAIATGYIQNNLVIKCLNFFVNIAYKRPELIIAQSPSFISRIKRYTSHKKQIRYLPNFYLPPCKKNIEIQNDNYLQSLSNQLQSCFSVVFSGNLGKAQSLLTILDAGSLLTSNQNIHIFLMGSGSMQTILRKKIIEKGLKNISIVGRFESDIAYKLMSMSKSLLITLSDNPAVSCTIPSKVQCYLSLGVPIIASVNGASASVLKESGASLVCQSGDYKMMADNILKLSKMSDDSRTAMGKKGRLYFESNFSDSIIIPKLFRLVESMSNHSINSQPNRQNKNP